MNTTTDFHVRVDEHTGRFTFTTNGITVQGGQARATLLVGQEEQIISLELNGTPRMSTRQRTTPHGVFSEQTLHWTHADGYECTWSVGVGTDLPGVTLHGSVTSNSDAPVRLHDFTLFRTPVGGIQCEGNPTDWYLSTLEHSQRVGNLAALLPSLNEADRSMWQGWNLPIPYELPDDERHTDGRWRTFYDFLTLYTDGGQRGMAFGAVGRPEADLRFDCFVDDGAIQLAIVCEMSDVLLAPGETRMVQQVALLGGPYHDAVGSILRWVAATHGQRTERGPLVGWCSWYDRGPDISAESIAATTAAFGALRDQFVPQVIQIDDGYQRQVGDWRYKETFPDGARRLVEQIQSLGALPGIWLAPLAVHDSLGILAEHPDWFQRDAHGALVGESNNWGPTAHWLDSTHPDVQVFLGKALQAKRDEGFTYFKIDFNTLGRTVRFYNPHLTRLQAFRNLYQLYREAIGEQAYLLACTSFGRAVMSFADASRIGPDSVAIWEALHPCTILESIRALGMNAIGNMIAFANDPDVTYLRPRGTNASPTGEAISAGEIASLTEGEWQTWHSFVGLLGGAMFISDPIQQPHYATHIRALEILNPPVPERGQSWHAGVDRNHGQFGFLAERPWGNFAAMMLWNPGEEPSAASLDVRGLEALGTQFHVWSFWDEQYLGVHDSNFATGVLSPHSPALLRLTALSTDDAPTLVGSSLHIGLGAAEIADIQETDKQYTIALRDAGAHAGALYIHSKHRLSLVFAEACTVEMADTSISDIWAVQITNRQHGREQFIQLSI